MSDLKNALLDAKYIDMISLADFVVRDLGLPEEDEDGNLMPQTTEIAASLFRWAAGARVTTATRKAVTLDDFDDAEDDAADGADLAGFTEYDENGDPIMDAEEAERIEAARKAEGMH